jgi:nicotinate-nucleotide pyrophosphorylase (carboxylating)
VLIERDLRSQIAVDAKRVAALALSEDGDKDVTTDVCVAESQIATGIIQCRSGGVVAGLTYADAAAGACGLSGLNWYHATGAALAAGTTIGLLQGDLSRILRAERPLLNLLQRAVGIATMTRAYVDLVAGTGAQILHTRKTAPGLRLLDVTAVLAGGGHPHRLGLSDILMVKDNHWRALHQSGRGLDAAIGAARAMGVSDCFVEVESLDQLSEACAAGATRLLIDNQTPQTVQSWGAKARAEQPGIEIEATGGITLANVRAFAEAGADYISIGALTHSVVAADVALELGSET